MKKVVFCASFVALLFTSSIQAATVTGSVIRVEGRSDSSCQYVFIKQTDNNTVILRIPSDPGSKEIQAIAMTALVSGTRVEVNYAQRIMCGGTESAIAMIAMLAQ